MSKAVEMLLGEKTRIVISVSTLLLVLVSTITFVWSVSAMKTEIDISINSLESADVRIEEKFNDSVYSIECEIDDVIIEQKEIKATNVIVQAQLSGIQTDLKWIIEAMKNK